MRLLGGALSVHGVSYQPYWPFTSGPWPVALAGSGSGSGSGRSGGSGHPPVVLAAERDMIRDDNGWNMGKSDPNYFEIKLKYLECNIYVYI